jgi:biotin carboxyl carrier protein
MTRPGKNASPAGKDKDIPGKEVRTGEPKAVLEEHGENADAEDSCDKKVRYKSLVIGGTKYRTLSNKKFDKRARWTNPDQRKIFSVIPGTVIKIFISEGDRVSAGDSMIVLEAMKMKNKVVFPSGGVVKKIRVKEGEKIPKGFLMVELEG